MTSMFKELTTFPVLGLGTAFHTCSAFAEQLPTSKFKATVIR